MSFQNVMMMTTLLSSVGVGILAAHWGVSGLGLLSFVLIVFTFFQWLFA